MDTRLCQKRPWAVVNGAQRHRVYIEHVIASLLLSDILFLLIS